MPNPRTDSRGLQFVDITDFTPGIYSASPTTSDIAPPSTVPAPFGSCTPATYSCLPIPSGGLAPGPGKVATVAVPSSITSAYKTSTPLIISSFYSNKGLYTGTAALELLYIIEGLSAAPQWLQNVYSTLTSVSPSTHLIGTQTYTTVTSSTLAGGTIIYATRMAASNPTTTPGAPTVIIPTTQPVGSNPLTTQAVYAYQDPTATPGTTFTALNLNATPNNIDPSLSVMYQGRVVIFNIYNYPWPGGLDWTTNDPLAYTDPSNSTTLLNQSLILEPEAPYGYWAAGSISAGELFLVKVRGGATVVTGDLNNPNVTALPGCQDGGGPANQSATTAPGIGHLPQYGRGDSSSNGYYYASANAGAWVWSGGSISSKISPQLADNFFYNQEFAYALSNMQFVAKKWNELICFSNSYMFYETTNSWWKLAPTTAPNSPPYFWYDEDVNSINLYAAPVFAKHSPVYTGYSGICDEYSREYPAKTFHWQSNPISITEDNFADIREVTVVALADPGTASTCSLAVTLTTENGSVVTLTPVNTMADTGHSVAYRIPCQCKATSIQLGITSTNTAGGSYAPAPTIYSISIAYRPREKVKAQ